MPALTLNLTKPGERGSKLSLNLSKNEVFKVKLSWDGDTDLDLHALACFGAANDQPRVTAFEQILSTYNVKRRIGGSEVGTIVKAADGTFDILNKALVHSADAVDGALADVDEWVSVNPGKLDRAAGEVVEIPLVAMIHPQAAGRTFGHVRNACVSIEDASGKTLLTANLSSQFGSFIGVQMGSIMIDESGKAEFAQTAVGFNGDFNSVIENFS